MIVKYAMVAIGSAAIGYYFADQALKNKYELRLEAETEAVREYYEKRYQQKVVEHATKADPEFVEAAVNAAENLSKYAGVDVEPEVLATEMISAAEKEFDREEFYKDLQEGAEPEPVAVEALVPEAAKRPVTNYNHVSTPPKVTKEEVKKAETQEGDIELITPDAFRQNQFSFHQTALSFFSDGVLSNVEDKAVTPSLANVILGEKVIRILKADRSTRGGLDTFYVRNRTEEIELEIQIESETYSSVLGVEKGEIGYVKTKAELN